MFSCVGNDDDLRSVFLGADGAYAGMERDAIAVDNTTASAKVARELYAEARSRGFHFIDAPVSGGQAGAVNGQLTVMCGGDAPAFERAQPVAMAFAKAELAAGCELPTEGTVFFSLRDKDKTAAAAKAAGAFARMGFHLCATGGTAAWLTGQGVECERVNKVREGRPHIVDRIINGDVALVVNTPSGKHPREDEVSIRSTSWARRLPIITTVRALTAASQAVAGLKACRMDVKTLQEYTIDTHGKVPAPRV